MATRNVIKPFKLTTPQGAIKFDTGTQEIDDKLVNHWFVKAHLEPLKAGAEGVEKPPVDPIGGSDTGAPGGDSGDDSKKSEPKANAGAKRE